MFSLQTTCPQIRHAPRCGKEEEYMFPKSWLRPDLRGRGQSGASTKANVLNLSQPLLIWQQLLAAEPEAAVNLTMNLTPNSELHPSLPRAKVRSVVAVTALQVSSIPVQKNQLLHIGHAHQVWRADF